MPAFCSRIAPSATVLGPSCPSNSFVGPSCSEADTARLVQTTPQAARKSTQLRPPRTPTPETCTQSFSSRPPSNDTAVPSVNTCHSPDRLDGEPRLGLNALAHPT